MTVTGKLNFIALLCLTAIVSACGGGSGNSGGGEPSSPTVRPTVSPIVQPNMLTKPVLGERLFSDTNLSFNRTQSCATCHVPGAAFTDNRDNIANQSVSLGDDGVSFGDRNTPTITYASFSPDFEQDSEGDYMGGQFLDGRSHDLQAQAGEPFLSLAEMGMPDKRSVISRVMENSDYVNGFQALYGDTIFNDIDDAYNALTDAIAAFEKTDVFSPFDSKYDRFLRGEYTPTLEEELGMSLFFSNQFTNCQVCHQLKSIPFASGETFSNYRYENIGVPINTAARSINGKANGFIDHGLFGNPVVTNTIHDGKFKVPTLRNVAVTAPYMHNGVFADLKTVILFYDKFNNTARTINPETGLAWQESEVPLTVNREELDGAILSDDDVDALVAFLKMLTDAQYESLIN